MHGLALNGASAGQPLTVRHENAVGKLQTEAAAMVPAGPMRERFMSDTAALIARYGSRLALAGGAGACILDRGHLERHTEGRVQW